MALSRTGQGGGAFVGCRVTNSASQSIPDTTPTAITFDTERYDTEALHSTSSNTSRLTLTRTGKWSFGANIEFAPNATGVRGVYIKLNGTTYIGIGQHVNAGGGVSHVDVVTGEYDFTAGDYIEVFVVQTSTAALNVVKASNYSPEFWCRFLG